jgi:hypothetical protein
MSITPYPRGKSLRMGPQTHDFEGADLAAAEAARDSYFASNPTNLAFYDGNSDLLIRLIYTDVELTTKFMQRRAGSWIDVTPVVQGPNGEVVSLAGVPIGEIPYKLIDGTFSGSGMRVLENGSILAPPGFGVESGSVTFGDVLKLSEVAGFLGISNLLNDRQYTIVDYYTPRTAVSSEPTVFHLIEPEFEFISQPIDTTNIPDNPLIYDYTVINSARTNSIKFRTYAAMTNVRIKISQVSNGVVLKFLPNKTSWEKELDGLTWGVGDNTFDFTDSPVILSPGNVLRFEIRADVVALKGNALGVPYFTATLQRGVFDNVITDRVYTATDVKAKLESLSSPNKLSKTAIQDVVNTVNGGFGDVVITTGSIGAQPLDATLTGLAATTISAGDMIYATGVDTFSTVASSAFGRSTLVDTSAAAGRATYGLGDVATRNVDVANGIATLDGAGKLTQMPTKADVGLGNVDNTSDVNKPVSTAQSAAIAASIAAHNAAVDPHPQYTTTAEASAAAPVQSVAGKTGTVTLNTGDVTEAANLYYTDSRVDARVIAAGYTVKSASSLGGGSPVYKANTAGDISFRSIIGTGIASVTTNANDITINVPANTISSVNGQTGAVVLTTTNIAEGTNLYYTDARVGTYLTTNGYTVKSINNVGAGGNIYVGNTAGAVTLRSIVAGGGVTVTQNTNDVTISTPVITDGTYTPTLFNTTNVAASTSGVCMYTRIGNTVRVSGAVQIDPTNNNQSTVLGVSLPIASNFTVSTDCAGSGSAIDVAGQSCGILADPVNDRALIQYVNGSNANNFMYFSFTYRVL